MKFSYLKSKSGLADFRIKKFAKLMKKCKLLNTPYFSSTLMEGVISNYKGGRHTQVGNQMIIIPAGSDSKENAEKFVGKKVTWESPAGKVIKGEVRAAHGNSGAVRVLFETGMPGQSIGTKVKIE